MVDNLKGLSSIPTPVASALNIKTLVILKRDGHGLSFPVKSGCQMRFTRNKENLGGFYSYKQWGSIQKAIDAAISRNIQLRVLHPKQNLLYSPTDNVQWDESIDKRHNKVAYRYRAYYKNKEGKSAAKNFYFGYKRPSPDKQFHGYLTAKLFRKYFMIHGNDLDMNMFDDWKNVRLYTIEKEPFNWDQS